MEGDAYRISICVVCMNRLHYLKQTLIQNIKDNSNYQNLEFVLLNYNSSDSMHEWVEDDLTGYIESGRLVYYRTSGSYPWDPSHSKNIAFKLATGDIICNMWADYYTGTNFANYVNERFKKDNNIVLTPIDFYQTKKNYSPPGDVLGKVCVKKSDFLLINGFDEKINKHGFEDYDFINRLEMIGVKRVLIENSNFLKFLVHGDSERFDFSSSDLEGIYIQHLTPSSSKVLILYKNSVFYHATIINNITADSINSLYAHTKRNTRFDFTLAELDWDTGTWKHDGLKITFHPVSSKSFHLVKNEINGHKTLTASSELSFFLLNDEKQIASVLKFKHFHDTRKIMEDNLDRQTSIVNLEGYGITSVSRNFETGPPLFL